MPIIKLETKIKASPETCFDLSRSIDAHVGSMAKSNEQAIAGVTTGLIGLGETVTWKARHFGMPMKMTVKITQLEMPYSFTDEMIKGPFSKMKHKHLFSGKGDFTVMIDVFEYSSPLGLLGNLADALFLRRYMERLLTARNVFIKKAAESSYSLDNYLLRNLT